MTKDEWQIAPCLIDQKEAWTLRRRTPPNMCWTPVYHAKTIKRAKEIKAHLMRKPIELK